MVDSLITSNYLQTELPTIRDAFAARVPVGSYSSAGASATFFTLPGLYGPGSYITKISYGGTVTGNQWPDATVQYRNESGFVGTVYLALGTTVDYPGAYLGKPLATTAWLHVTPMTVATMTAADDTRMIVEFVREA